MLKRYQSTRDGHGSVGNRERGDRHSVEVGSATPEPCASERECSGGAFDVVGGGYPPFPIFGVCPSAVAVGVERGDYSVNVISTVEGES